MSFRDTFYELMVDQGVAWYALPFIIIFTVIFGVLDKAKLFAKDDKSNMKSTYVVISSIFAFLGTYFINFGYDAQSQRLRDALTHAVPVSIVFIVASLFIIVLIASFGLDKSFYKLLFGGKAKGFQFSSIIVILSLLIIVLIFLNSLNIFSFPPAFSFLNSDALSYFVPILIFGLIVTYVTKEPDGNDE
ncbi:MAG: hypothetical protein ACOCRX_00210 [Candidatus Woesearchaeota archaeon]